MLGPGPSPQAEAQSLWADMEWTASPGPLAEAKAWGAEVAGLGVRWDPDLLWRVPHNPAPPLHTTGIHQSLNILHE